MVGTKASTYHFDISQPTISRTIKTIEKALEKALTPLVPSLEESLKAPGSLVIDRTLIPTWNWSSQGKRNFSGQHKRAGFNQSGNLHPRWQALSYHRPATWG